jgi:hypothetical protein
MSPDSSPAVHVAGIVGPRRRERRFSPTRPPTFGRFAVVSARATFKPDPRHENEVQTLRDRLVSWARALQTVRAS